MSALGRVLREYRTARGMSLRDVADEAGCAKAHVWELEVGRADNPSVSTLVGLGVALNVSPVLLFSAAVTPDGSQNISEPREGASSAPSHNNTSIPLGGEE